MSTRAYQEKVYNAKNAQNAAQAAQEAAIAQAQSNIARTNNQLINAYNAQNATPKVYIHTNDASIDNASPATLKQQPSANPNGGGGTYQQSAAPASNPYADLMAIYQQKLDAQNAANEQRRQSQLSALNSNYANAKSRLSDAFNSGETALNNDANQALREAYVQSRLNERNLNQRLQSMGINGGAMESSLARAYNEYGNSRNAIEQNRIDALKELLSQHQGQLGDLESAYSANLADLDSNYFGNGLDFVTDFYDAIAALQKQNAASNLQAQLGKRSSSSTKSGDTADADTKAIVNVLKNFKSSPSSALTYLNNRGIVGADAEDLLWQAGIDPTLLNSLNEPVTEATANATLGGNALGGLTQSAKNNIINTLKRVASLSRGTGDAYANAAAQMDQFARQYNLTQEEASALLAAAGF